MTAGRPERALSRRRFLGSAALGVSATVLVPLLAACSSSPSAPPASSAPTTSASSAANPTSAPTAAPAASASTPAAASAAQPTTAPAASAPQSQGPVTLKVWKFGGTGQENNYMPTQNKVFTDKTGIKVDWSSLDWGTKREKVTAAYMAKKIADVLLPDGQSIPDFVGLNIITALDDIDKSMVGNWQPSFIPEIWSTTVWKGKFYAMSVYVDAAPFLGYNKKLLADAGLTTNGQAAPPTSWTDLKSDAIKLTKGNTTGFVFQASLNTNDVNIFEGVAYANGGRWVNDDGSKIVINDQGVVDALQLYADMVKANAAPKNVVQTDFSAAGTMFMNGQGAMWNCMSWIGAFAQGNPPKFDWGSMVFPTNEKPSGSFTPASLIMTTTLGFMVTTLSPYKTQAMQYTDFWTKPEVQKAWDGSVVWGRVPALKANWESDTFKKLNPDWYAQYKAGNFFKGALPMPMFSGLTEVEQMLSENIQKTMLGQMTPKQALDDVQKNAEPIYDQLNNM